MRLAIVGSVRLADNPEAARIIEEVLDDYQPTLVISGGAEGIDTMAVQAARRRGIPVQEFKPTVHRWAGPGGFQARNAQIAHACEALVRIVAAPTPGVKQTYGSGWTRDLTERLGKPTTEYVVTASGLKSEEVGPKSD